MRRSLHALFGLVLLSCGLLLFLGIRVAPRSPSSLLQKGARRHRPDRFCAHARLALVLVTSANAHRRQLIRETWAHTFYTRPLGLGVAFVVSPGDESTDFEAEMFGDIILSQRTSEGVLSLLQAAREACRRPHFLVKAQEDFFVNAFTLASTLHELKNRPLHHQRRNTIWCHVWEGATVVTANDSGWFLSHEDNATARPRHCLPGVFVMGTGAADALLLTERPSNASRTIIDDVFVTGELARHAGVELVQMAERYDHRVQTMDEGRLLGGQTIFARVGPEWEDGRMEGLWHRLVESRKERGL